MEKLRQKHACRNSILGSQTQSVITFHTERNQQKQSVTTSDTNEEFVEITMKPCETSLSLW